MITRIVTRFARVYGRLGILDSLILRWILALGFTLLATILLLQPSGNPVIGPAAPPGTPDLWREIQLTVGHVVVFFALVVLWWWTLRMSLPSPRALFVAVGFALLFGLLTEIAQTLVADRQASLFDMAVNWTVTIGTAVAIAERGRKQQRLPGL